jgi:hypothetical protein
MGVATSSWLTQITIIFASLWPRGTAFSQLPSAVISTVDHPLGFPSRLITSQGRVSTLAGSGAKAGIRDQEGDVAQFYGPSGVAVDGDGNGIVAVASRLIR